MRLVMVMVLAGLVALPLRVSAQAGEDDPLSGEPAPSPEPAEEGATSEPNVVDAVPSAEPAPEEPCPKGKRNGAVGGIVVASVFYTLLPMSIPVLITQSQKLKAHNKAMSERRCQYAPEEFAWQFKPDDAGLGVAPGYPPRFDELELRVKRARNAMIASAGVVVVGSVLIGVASSADSDCTYSLIGPDEGSCTNWGFSVTFTGAFVVAAGIMGLATSGGIMAARKRKLRKQEREWQELHTHYRKPRRVQWDLAQSRLVF